MSKVKVGLSILMLVSLAGALDIKTDPYTNYI